MINMPMLDIAFQKIAVANSEIEEAKAKALMSGMGAGSLGSSILGAGAGLLAEKTQPSWDPLTEGITKSLASKKGLKNIKFEENLLSKILGGAGYNPATRTILNAGDVPTAFHELGHAANHRAAEASRSDRIKVACDNLANHTMDVIGTVKQIALEEFHKEACSKGYSCTLAEAEEAIVKQADLDDDLATLLLLRSTTFSEERT